MGGEDEEEFLLAFEVFDGADTIKGADLIGAEFAVGIRVEGPPRRPPLAPRPRSLRLALLRPLFGLRGIESRSRSPVCLQSGRVEVGPGGGGMEREAMRDR